MQETSRRLCFGQAVCPDGMNQEQPTDRLLPVDEHGEKTRPVEERAVDDHCLGRRWPRRIRPEGSILRGRRHGCRTR